MVYDSMSNSSGYYSPDESVFDTYFDDQQDDLILDDCLDGLRICLECGDKYTTGDLCNDCERQHMIDNDPMEGF